MFTWNSLLIMDTCYKKGPVINTTYITHIYFKKIMASWTYINISIYLQHISLMINTLLLTKIIIFVLIMYIKINLIWKNWSYLQNISWETIENKHLWNLRVSIHITYLPILIIIFLKSLSFKFFSFNIIFFILWKNVP